MFKTEALQDQLESNHFQIYLHPLYDTALSKMTNVEAVVKYCSDTDCLDYEDFSSELEEKDLVGMLDLWVLDKVFQLQKHTIEQQHSAIPLSVNVSPCTVSNPFNVYDIALNLKKYGLPHGSIQATLAATDSPVSAYSLEKGIGFLQRQGIQMKTVSGGEEPEKLSQIAPDLLTQEEFYNIQSH